MMSIRFIVGRAGTGKTHHCLESIRDQLRNDPIHGPRLIYLVPEQASLQIEQSILKWPDDCPIEDQIQCVHRVEILSFQRLAYRVLNSAGSPVRQALTEPARAMVLRHLLTRHSNELQFYSRIARPGKGNGRLGGFSQKLDATISEFIQEAVDPDDLTTLIKEKLAKDGHDPAQAAKLHDLQLIYKSYLDYLGTQRFDPSQHLQLARESLVKCDWLRGAHLWVDGFASYSGQELQLLISLVQMCTRAELTVLMDPALCDEGKSNSPTFATHRLFSKTCRTYQDLHRTFTKAGLEFEEPLRLQPRCPPRFSSSPAIAQLELNWGVDRTQQTSENHATHHCVELVELPSRRVEVDYAVSRVCSWVQDQKKKYRYRDIALIVRDLEPYHDLLSHALTARGIPFFIDHRRSVSHHPMIELIRALVAMVVENCSLVSVRSGLKTGLIPLTSEQADELENYLIAHGISGLNAWRGDDWTYFSRSSFAGEDQEPSEYQKQLLQRVNVTRQTMMQHLDPWFTFAIDKPHTGSEWTAAIIRLMEKLSVGKSLHQWSEEAEADGDLDLAEEHRQIWNEMMSFLDDLAFAFADTSLTVQELADIFEAGLTQFTLGLIPPTVDQVLVGSIERSRHPDIKVAVILGFNDGIFPRQHNEDSILNDDDRSLMQDSGMRIGPPSRERVIDESMLGYIAMTRAANELVVTYATSDQDGKALQPSPFTRTLCTACGDISLQTVFDPSQTRESWDIQNTSDILKRLTMEIRTRPVLVNEPKELRGRWNELYDHVRGEFAQRASSRFAFSSLGDLPKAKLSSESVERNFSGTFQTSVSQLETYAACPFQYFTKHILRLKQRDEAELAPIDVGHVHHAILEDFVRSLVANNEAMDRLDESAVLDRLRDSCSRIATRIPDGGAMSDARSTYMLRRSAAQMARMIRAQKKVSGSGSFKPKATELPFGFHFPGSLPAIELSTPAGRNVHLRGYIDRVDLAELGDELLGMVIDYKRTRDKKLTLDSVYHGLSLQLIGYLLVLAEHGRTLAGRSIRPIGALYVSLMSRYHKVDHPSHTGDRDISLRGTYRTRGLLREETYNVLDTQTHAGWSEDYNVFINKEGQHGHLEKSDIADSKSFDRVLEHTRLKLGELADSILDGHVSVNPCRLRSYSPCAWCSMADVCRFEMGISDVRFLDSLKRSEVFIKLANTTENIRRSQ